MDLQQARRAIEGGECVLGIELGSTRIKAVLIDNAHRPLALGSHAWENQLENGVWTYAMDDVWTGIQDAYQNLLADVQKKYGARLTRLEAMGVSAMMHGYLPLDENGKLLTPFRTWRNTAQGEAAEKLTKLFSFNVPMRFSIAHLYQAMLNKEAHVKDIARLTTLAGYVHFALTGENVLGVGEASGMFPIDSQTLDYDAKMLAAFDALSAHSALKKPLKQLLPRVLCAGENAGRLTKEGAALLDISGALQAGAQLCPPEGDAGTGMVATNSVRARTGNISAGTSVFSMVVLEHPLSHVYPMIDMVTTPSGAPVAMVHCNNCTSDINAWASLLFGFARAAGCTLTMDQVYETLFSAALAGEKDCGGVVNVNFLSGEPIAEVSDGRPMLLRLPSAQLTLQNFARSLLCGAVATLRLGMEILEEERVQIDSMLGQGGFFKTTQAGQTILSAALSSPITVMETAGEGGAWGMALLAAYSVLKEKDEPLDEYLEKRVFASASTVTVTPTPEDIQGFNRYMENFKAALPAQRAAQAFK